MLTLFALLIIKIFCFCKGFEYSFVIFDFCIGLEYSFGILSNLVLLMIKLFGFNMDFGFSF